MEHSKNTQGSVWLAILIIIAVVVAALLLSNGALSPEADEPGITGRVDTINQEEHFFTLEEIEVLSVDRDGTAETRETTYTVVWDDDIELLPHDPELLEGGEMVRAIPNAELNDDQRMFYLQSLEIIRGPNSEDEAVAE